jgi:hypothetical protein
MYLIGLMKTRNKKSGVLGKKTIDDQTRRKP